MPRRIVASVAAKFGEVEKRLRMKPSNIEEVADQRQFVESLPRKVAELVAETDAAQVPSQACLLLHAQHCLQTTFVDRRGRFLVCITGGVSLVYYGCITGVLLVVSLWAIKLVVEFRLLSMSRPSVCKEATDGPLLSHAILH